MHRSPTRVIDRAERVLRERVEAHVHTAVSAMDVAIYELEGEPVRVSQIVEGGVEKVDFVPFGLPGKWGGVWTTTWFRMTGVVPAGVDTVELFIEPVPVTI